MAVGTCCGVWIWLAVRASRGVPSLPYQPRRQVPWQGLDVLLVFGLFYLLPALVAEISAPWFQIDFAPPAAGDETPLDAEHPLTKLLIEGPNAGILVLAVFSAIVVAPIVEEFLFRVVLQGWFESLERRFRRQMRHIAPGAIPIVLSSLPFAAVHFRSAAPTPPVDVIVFLVAVRTVASLLTLGLAVAWLRFRTKATFADLGVVPRKLPEDVKIGLVAYLAVTVPIYLVLYSAHILAGLFLPSTFVVDPLPLLLLALTLGTLCYRTRRVGSAIVLHTVFNATAVLMALTQMK